MPSYSWLTFISARQQLAQRLYDPNMDFWGDAELAIYIQQALRMFNVLTNTWKTDFTFNAGAVWNPLSVLTGSPRLRTKTDVNCYTQMEYMLLEPPTGGTWTGTPQFNITALAQALQLRRDEMLMVSNCNQQLMPNIGLTPNNRRTILPDTVIDVARMRYLPVGSQFGGGATGPPTTLYRDDTVALEWFESPLYQLSGPGPNTFMLTSEPPLSFDVDIAPNLPGTYEAVVLLSGAQFAPPTATLINIPDDFSWVLIWGALSDLLGRESEATDRQRADYCLKRYMDGLNLLLKTPWIMLANITGVAVTTQSIPVADRYSPGWDTNPATIPFVVTGGIDFFATATGTSTGLTVLGNAPVPALDTDYVQVARSDWDTVLDLAQVFAVFKCGGADFQSVLEIETRAIQACAAENARLKSMGAFADVLAQRGGAEDRDQERYNTAGSGSAKA